ncbi:alkyl sulfatase dimerization domain-containing protein [Ilumatobacter sp.]|uniref:alkyl sulfatase dimerization domain-containing protein n=1 Tax=Ilumatobacter sp. TaxID=1967498 RepID=UPI003B524DE5
MSEHPIELSTRMIDTGVVDTPSNRVTEELSELADGVAIVESFSHVVAVRTDDGLVAFDSSGSGSGAQVVEALRRWDDDPVHSIVYTHGHLDHVGGSAAFAADAEDRGRPRPRVVGHERILDRFERYELTSGYNRMINMRQFGGAARSARRLDERPFLPDATLRPDVTYEDHRTETIGGVEIEMHHCEGETDDHTWSYLPGFDMISAGDQFIWNFPNCGNPQKVQRYPVEWAESLRAMAAKGAELFVPAHGLPIAGRDRIRTCLETVATTLEDLVADVIEAMNAGAVLDEILHTVTVPDEALDLPYLQPLYDEPEFVVRNIWRLYGGWYDGNPARLKPAPDATVGAEVVDLAGGIDRVIERARATSTAGDHRLACHLIEFAVAADPSSPAVHEARRAIYAARRGGETSLMAKGIFKSAEADSTTVIDGEAPPLRMIRDLGD